MGALNQQELWRISCSHEMLHVVVGGLEFRASQVFPRLITYPASKLQLF